MKAQMYFALAFLGAIVPVLLAGGPVFKPETTTSAMAIIWAGVLLQAIYQGILAIKALQSQPDPPAPPKPSSPPILQQPPL